MAAKNMPTKMHEPLAKSLDPIVLIPILFIYNFCFAAFGSSKIGLSNITEASCGSDSR